MWSKSRDWKEEPIDETKIDWATGLTPDEIEKQEEKKQKAKKALAQIKKKEVLTKTEVKSDQEIYPISRLEQIKSYVESLPQPSVEQIIKNRAAIRTRYSGIGSLNFKESEFQIERPKSLGLNYLRGLDDDEIT
jgi:phage repressor protein C with HTH and peptisase S24 domain